MLKLLIAYDDSPDARTAVTRAGALFDGASAVVLTVWEGFSEVVARAGNGMVMASVDFEEIDRASEAAGAQCARYGTTHARAAGLAATPRVTRRRGSIWETVIAEADAEDVDLIVMGSRGLTGVKSLLLGSVSRAVLQHAHRPVLIIPAGAAGKRSDYPVGAGAAFTLASAR